MIGTDMSICRSNARSMPARQRAAWGVSVQATAVSIAG
jgi:hypothetical protein